MVIPVYMMSCRIHIHQTKLLLGFVMRFSVRDYSLLRKNGTIRWSFEVGFYGASAGMFS